MKKNTLAQSIKTLANKIEKKIEHNEQDLNIIIDKSDSDYEYDPSKSFRKEVINQGYRIKTLIAVYYQGWECDEWACIAEKDGSLYKITTDHGTINTIKI